MLSVIKKVLPDAYEQLLRRYQILKVIKNDGPIGRRLLSEKLQFTERLTRNEVELLKQQGLISTAKVGMTLSTDGLATLNQLSQVFERQSRLSELEESLEEHLQIKKCKILPGDMDQDRQVLSDMADKTVDVMNQILGEGKQVIAVMGGSTLNEVAEHMNKSMSYKRDLLFVPARGGLGDHPQKEANIIGQRMAQRTGGQVHGLYAPAHVHQEIYEELLNEPEIKQTLELIENASMILYSIGNPIEMAERRGLDADTIKLLNERKAVAEVFGEFINQAGEVVYKLSNIGLRSSSLRKIEHNVAIAGGSKKAAAISSYLKIAPSHTWLITDEAAANKILNGGNPLK